MRYNDQITKDELDALCDSDLIGFAVVREVAKIDTYEFLFNGVSYPTLKVFPIQISKELRDDVTHAIMDDNVNYSDDWD